jgi:ABC-2 type transport system permease protein
MQDDIRYTRADLGQVASFAFGFFALMAFIATLYEGQVENYIIVLIVLAGLGLAGWVILAPQEFISTITGRGARRGTVAVFATLLFVGIVVMFYILVERQVLTFDLTEGGDFTLSDTTVEVVERLNRDIRIIGFYSAANIAVRDLDDQYWRQYEVISDGRITRQYIDPVEQPALAAAYEAQDGDVFIAFEDENGEIVEDSIAYVPIETAQEREMTQAINRLLQQGNFAAFFDVSHGQRRLDDTSGAGLTITANLLGLNGWRVVEFDLKDLVENDQPIPDEASVVILARPREAFPPETIATLDDYLDRGGSVFILADTTFGEGGFLAEDSPFNDYLWQNWGLRVLDAIIVQQDPNIDTPTPLDVISFQVFDSPITSLINIPQELDSFAQFRIARPIAIDDTPPVNNGVAVLTSPASYAETNVADVGLNDSYEFNQGEDLPGQQAVVAFGIDSATEGRVLVIGDSDFLSDGQIQQPPGNALLFVGALNWLSDFDEQVEFGFTTGAVAPPTIFVSPNQLDQINVFVLIIVPGLALLLGAGMWYVRSRR